MKPIVLGTLWGALAIPLLPCTIWTLDRMSGSIRFANNSWLVLTASVVIVIGASAIVHRTRRITVVTAVTALLLAGILMFTPLAALAYACAGRPL